MRIISMNGMINLNFSDCAVYINSYLNEILAMCNGKCYKLGTYSGLKRAIYEMQNIEISYEAGLKVYQLRGDG